MSNIQKKNRKITMKRQKIIEKCELRSRQSNQFKVYLGSGAVLDRDGPSLGASKAAEAVAGSTDSSGQVTIPPGAVGRSLAALKEF